MDKCRIVIIDDNRNFCKILKDFIELQQDMEVVGVAHCGQKGFELIVKTNPDIVLLDIVMPKYDGLHVLERMNAELSDRPKVIIISSLGQEIVTNTATKLGADFYIIKPLNFHTLADRIRYFLPKRSSNEKTIEKIKTNEGNFDEITIEKQISNILSSIRITPNLKGYHLIIDAVKLAMNYNNMKSYVTKDIYPVVAEKHEMNSSQVERVMRYAVATAWNFNEKGFVEKILGTKYTGRESKPTNSEFLAILADSLQLKSIV